MAVKEPSRRAHRQLAFQALYGQEFLDCTTVEKLKQAFLAVPRQDEAPEDEEPSGFAWELVLGVWQHRDELDAVIEKFARNWRLDRVGRVELNLLRLGVYEMLYRADVPCKVSMNEALELDKQYGDARSHTFVNGILDAVSKAMEKGELRPRS
ncbi:MAG: transcription antitermination factor NusB [Mailhella sp.]|nr:transcription antitermination factor NusB [Mailhella sp.]MBQ8744341.1 transcription antitermination factor NusB [Mailhella sp.]MBQ9105500.1 transcription antitermination factor NusB [Mailhella sp.]